MSARNILVFGSTGGTGRSLIEQSLEQGWSVAAFARRPEALDDLRVEAEVKSRLTVHKGDLTSKDDVTAALAASKPDVLVFAAGKPWPAWSERMTKVTVYEEGITSVCEAMREAGLEDRRLIVIASTAHVGVPGEAKLNMVSPWFFRFLGRIYESMHRMEEALAHSYKDINWVVVRPPQLKDGIKKEKYVTNANFTTKEMKAVINRADLAQFLLTDAVTTSDEYKHISAVITRPKRTRALAVDPVAPWCVLIGLTLSTKRVRGSANMLLQVSLTSNASHASARFILKHAVDGLG